MRILVVDDEPLARRRLIRMLGRIPGVSVAGEAADARSALDLIRKDRPDLVLLDIRMRGLSGLELAASGEDLPPIVFTTAYDQYAVQAFEVSAVDYLLKPVKPERLRAAIDKVRRQSAIASTAQIQSLLERLDRKMDAVAPSLPPRGSLMDPQAVERRLAAILSADVVGYSRLMAQDEVATVRMLTTCREEIAKLIYRDGGRVVDAPGDNVLAEFPSVVAAVGCGMHIQSALASRNAGLAASSRMRFRIGINLGDVIVEGERIYGDGVNIAARLEQLADADGLCISGTVFDQVQGKLELRCEALGERTLKNIAIPVRVYRVRLGPDDAAVSPESKGEGDA